MLTVKTSECESWVTFKFNSVYKGMWVNHMPKGFASRTRPSNCKPERHLCFIYKVKKQDT